jgi:hypothetical protein
MSTFRTALFALIASTFLVATAGCGGDPDSPAGSGGSAGAPGSGGGSTGGGGGGGAAPTCDGGTHLGESGACEATLTAWNAAPSLLEARDHHVTFVAESNAGPYLYVAGGVRDMMYAVYGTERAAIQGDGTLGAWEDVGDGDIMIGGMVATVGDTVVLSAGMRTTSLVLSTETTIGTIDATGMLTDLHAGPELAAGRFHHGSVAIGNNVYVVGGLTGDGTDSTPLVERATVDADGNVSDFTETTPLPERRSHFGIATTGDAIYVSGGLIGDPAGAATPLTEVLRATIDADGNVVEWTKVGDLPTALETHSSFVEAGMLYVVGGVENNWLDTAAVKRAPILDDGSLGDWEDTTPLPAARAHAHQTPLRDGFVYSAGGALDHDSTDAVFVGVFE